MNPDYRNHVGLAPYVDAFGNTRASYQQLDETGHAIGVLEVCNGNQERLATLWNCDAGSLIQFAQRHFNTTEPTRFGKS